MKFYRVAKSPVERAVARQQIGGARPDQDPERRSNQKFPKPRVGSCRYLVRASAPTAMSAASTGAVRREHCCLGRISPVSVSQDHHVKFVKRCNAARTACPCPARQRRYTNSKPAYNLTRSIGRIVVENNELCLGKHPVLLNHAGDCRCLIETRDGNGDPGRRRSSRQGSSSPGRVSLGAEAHHIRVKPERLVRDEGRHQPRL